MPFDLDSFQAALTTSHLGHQVVHKLVTGSTNDDVKAAGEAGLPHGTLILAESQHSGRGRRGNTWAAPAGCNLLCSLLLRLATLPDSWHRYTHTVGLAIAKALEISGLEPKLKWPNDVYLADRKVAGILLETSWQRSEGVLVAGFGINVLGGIEIYPPELQSSLTTVAAEGAVISREILLAQILNHLEPLLETTAVSFPEILDQVWARSWLRGQRVSLISEGTEHHGTAVGLSGQGGLLLSSSNGNVREFWAADQVRRLVRPF